MWYTQWFSPSSYKIRCSLQKVRCVHASCPPASLSHSSWHRIKHSGFMSVFMQGKVLCSNGDRLNKNNSNPDASIKVYFTTSHRSSFNRLRMAQTTPLKFILILVMAFSLLFYLIHQFNTTANQSPRVFQPLWRYWGYIMRGEKS